MENILEICQSEKVGTMVVHYVLSLFSSLNSPRHISFSYIDKYARFLLLMGNGEAFYSY